MRPRHNFPDFFEITVSYDEENELISFEELKLHMDIHGSFQFESAALCGFLFRNAKLRGFELLAVLWDLTNVYKTILLWYEAWHKETGKVDHAAEALLERLSENPNAFSQVTMQ